jgi:hypothetical protein
MIYFTRAKQDTGEIKAGMIKIGTTIRLSERLKQLPVEYGTDVELIAVLDGDHTTEGDLHRQFDHLRVVGEWFLPDEDLLEFIAARGREWDGIDEAPPMPCMSKDLKTVFLEKDLASKAYVIAKLRGMITARYLSAKFRVDIEKDYVQVLRETGETKRSPSVANDSRRSQRRPSAFVEINKGTRRVATVGDNRWRVR